MTKKRRRPIHLHVMVSEEELALIQERMAEAGIRDMGAYMRKMALHGYVLHVDLSPVQELVSLQRRCSNNLNRWRSRRTPTAVFTRRRSRRCSGTMKSCGGPCPIFWQSSPPLCGSDLPGSGPVPFPGYLDFWTFCPEVGIAEASLLAPSRRVIIYI